jgi:hypothetical protein
MGGEKNLFVPDAAPCPFVTGGHQVIFIQLFNEFRCLLNPLIKKLRYWRPRSSSGPGRDSLASSQLIIVGSFLYKILFRVFLRLMILLTKSRNDFCASGSR